MPRNTPRLAQPKQGLIYGGTGWGSAGKPRVWETDCVTLGLSEGSVCKYFGHGDDFAANVWAATLIKLSMDGPE